MRFGIRMRAPEGPPWPCLSRPSSPKRIQRAAGANLDHRPFPGMDRRDRRGEGGFSGWNITYLGAYAPCAGMSAAEK